MGLCRMALFDWKVLVEVLAVFAAVVCSTWHRTIAGRSGELLSHPGEFFPVEQQLPFSASNLLRQSFLLAPDLRLSARAPRTPWECGNQRNRASLAMRSACHPMFETTKLHSNHETLSTTLPIGSSRPVRPGRSASWRVPPPLGGTLHALSLGTPDRGHGQASAFSLPAHQGVL